MRTTQIAFPLVLWWLTVALGAGPDAAIDEAFPQGLVYKPPGLASYFPVLAIPAE